MTGRLPEVAPRCRYASTQAESYGKTTSSRNILLVQCSPVDAQVSVRTTELKTTKKLVTEERHGAIAKPSPL
jgi:hypothetical protein